MSSSHAPTKLESKEAKFALAFVAMHPPELQTTHNGSLGALALTVRRSHFLKPVTIATNFTLLARTRLLRITHHIRKTAADAVFGDDAGEEKVLEVIAATGLGAAA